MLPWKSPYSVRDMLISEVWNGVQYLEMHEGKLELKQGHSYYTQIIGEIAVSGLERRFFLLFEQVKGIQLLNLYILKECSGSKFFQTLGCLKIDKKSCLQSLCVVHTTPADYSCTLFQLTKFPQVWKPKKRNNNNNHNNNNRFYFKNSMKKTHVNPGLDNQGTEYDRPGVYIRWLIQVQHMIELNILNTKLTKPHSPHNAPVLSKCLSPKGLFPLNPSGSNAMSNSQ